MSETGISSSLPDYRKVVIKKGDETRYDWSGTTTHEQADNIYYPELKISGVNEYTTGIIKMLLRYINKTREPKTIEFIDHPRWKQPSGEIERLRGVILRDAPGNVLLYAYGFGLDSLTGSMTQVFFDSFNISPEDRLRTKNTTWPALTYSVIIDLDPEGE